MLCVIKNPFYHSNKISKHVFCILTTIFFIRIQFIKITRLKSPRVGSSHSEVFLRKGVLKICSKFTGEHPCQSVISIKLLCNFIEITLRHGCSSVNLLHIFRTLFPKNASEWLLLKSELKNLLRLSNKFFKMVCFQITKRYTREELLSALYILNVTSVVGYNIA